MIDPLEKMKQSHTVTSSSSVHKQINNLKQIVKKRDSELADLKQAIKTHLKITRPKPKPQIDDEVIYEGKSGWSSTLNIKAPIGKVSVYVINSHFYRS